MPTPDNLRATLENLYSALSRGDLATWRSMHSESVVFNISGNTIISGR